MQSTKYRNIQQGDYKQCNIGYFINYNALVS